MVLAGTATFLELSNQFEVPRQARGKVIRWNEIIVGAKLVEWQQYIQGKTLEELVKLVQQKILSDTLLIEEQVYELRQWLTEVLHDETSGGAKEANYRWVFTVQLG